MLSLHRYLYPICDKSLPESFFALEEANVHLDTISSAIAEITFKVSIIDSLDEAPQLSSRLEEARRQIRKWMDAFANIPVTDDNANEHRLTRIFCFYTWLSVETCQVVGVVVDDFEDQFYYIMDVIEEYVGAHRDSTFYFNLSSEELSLPVPPGLTIGTGLVSCICLIAAKCQDLSIRQRCLQVLTTIDPQGAIYSNEIVNCRQAVAHTAERKVSGG